MIHQQDGVLLSYLSPHLAQFQNRVSYKFIGEEPKSSRNSGYNGVLGDVIFSCLDSAMQARIPAGGWE